MINERDLEQMPLTDWIEHSFSLQSVALNAGVEKLFSFSHNIAKII